MNSTYRQNNHHQRHHWYTEVSWAPPRLFFFNQLFTPQFYKTPVKHFTKFLRHATQVRAFFAKKKKPLGYRWWRRHCKSDKKRLKEKNKQLHNKSNNCTLISELMVGTGVTVLETRGDWVGGGASVFSGNGTGDPARELHYAVEGTNTSSRRLFLRLQDTPLPFLGAPWMNFTHTLSCLNCTRNLSHTETWLNVIQADGESRSFDWDFTLHPLLLIWDVYVELLPVCSRGPGAVDFGDDLNQMFAAE